MSSDSSCVTKIADTTISSSHDENPKHLEFHFLESAPWSDSQEVSKLFLHETAIRRLQNMEEIIFQILSGAEVHL